MDKNSDMTGFFLIILFIHNSFFFSLSLNVIAWRCMRNETQTTLVVVKPLLFLIADYFTISHSAVKKKPHTHTHFFAVCSH